MAAVSAGAQPQATETATSVVYLRLTPLEVQAWREADELVGRRIMHEGRWLD
jgi:hypothetical protein